MYRVYITPARTRRTAQSYLDARLTARVAHMHASPSSTGKIKQTYCTRVACSSRLACGLPEARHLPWIVAREIATDYCCRHQPLWKNVHYVYVLDPHRLCPAVRASSSSTTSGGRRRSITYRQFDAAGRPAASLANKTAHVARATRRLFCDSKVRSTWRRGICF